MLLNQHQLGALGRYLGHEASPVYTELTASMFDLCLIINRAAALFLSFQMTKRRSEPHEPRRWGPRPQLHSHSILPVEVVAVVTSTPLV